MEHGSLRDPFDARLKSGLFQLCEHIAFLARLNLIMALTTLLGGVLLGIFPSVFAAGAVCRLYFEEREPPLLRTFWQAYRRWFKTANLFGAALTGALAAALCGLHWYGRLAVSPLSAAGLAVGLLAGVWCLLEAAYAPALFVTFPNARPGWIVRLAMVLGLTKWKLSLLIALVLAAAAVGTALMPQIGMFFALSCGPFLCGAITGREIRRIGKPSQDALSSRSH